MLKIALPLAALMVTPALAQQPAATAQSSASPSKYERIICKTMRETGSLIKKHKTCKTQAAWDKEAEAMRTNNVVDSCRLRGDGGSC